MGKPRIQRIGSKLTKAKLLMKNSTLINNHPDTKKLTEQTLKDMLSTYRVVFIKPIYGMHGNGVMRAEAREENYQLRSGARTMNFADFTSFYNAVKKRTARKPYMVQKGIHLLKYNNRPFDIRIMVQKNQKNKWEVSGKLCRVAHPKKVVTNVLRGGQVMSLTKLLPRYASKEKREHLLTKLNQLGLKTAKHLESKYPRIKELGMDVAIDSQLKPWILEVNTMPDLYLFCRLKDRRMFTRILQNARAYGRVKSKS
ncbi:YheC/YheD family protein [Brevibacillus ginsengisoli]|uniref:YheC/YheD family protein n=1 Tax=Brevibacillus ginsengisoli TaxID=363854 RepID=UPI003CF19FAA